MHSLFLSVPGSPSWYSFSPNFANCLLPGSRHWFMPTTGDPTLPFTSQRPCVAEPEPEATCSSSDGPRVLKSPIILSALSSLPLNFSWLPQISPRPFPLAQTKSPIPFQTIFPALLWIFFSRLQSFQALTFFFFYLEDIFGYCHP